MFGIEVIYFDNSKIFLNPNNFIIPEGIKCVAYIIATDKKIADEIFRKQYKTDDEEILVS
jgi:hypothetical protein